MDKLTALLEEHEINIHEHCRCGWETDYDLLEHQDHLAEMLKPLLAEVYAEGFREAEYESDGFTSVSGWTNRNPYATKETN